MRLVTLASVLVAAVVSLTASDAHAQGWLADRDTSEGRGFQLGRLEFHPGIGLEVGYDSNVFYNASGNTAAGILRVTPHLSIATRQEERRESDEAGEDDERAGSPQMVDFRAGLNASYIQYIGNATGRSNVDVGADLALTIAPQRPFSVSITENLSRTIRPFTDLAPVSYGRIQNTAGIRFNLQSSGGIFRGSAGYRLNMDFYEDSAFRYASRLMHEGQIEMSWRFLPQTALVHDTTVTFADYPSPVGSPVQLSDGVVLRSRLGINGAITRKLSLLVLLGYTAGFFVAGDDLDTVVGELQLRLRFSENVRLRIGFQRDLGVSQLGNFYAQTRGYTNLDLVFGGSFLLRFEGSVGHLGYGTIVGGSVSSPNRDDIVFSAGIYGEYRFVDWLALTASLGYRGRSTDFTFNLPGLVDPSEDYQKFEAFVGVRAFY